MEPFDSSDNRSERIVIALPRRFSFTYYGAYNFQHPLAFLDWNIKQKDVLIDLSRCYEANYQALSLLVLYAWQLLCNGCYVSFRYGYSEGDATKMWLMMGAPGLFHVLEGKKDNFQSRNYKPLFAIRDNEDFRTAREAAGLYTKGFDVEYEKTLRYVLSELLYNTLEHGKNSAIPSLIQFTWYREKGELSFIVADLGIGIYKHLRQAYPEIDGDVEAIIRALKPNISGTFFNKNSYMSKDNAGIGLFLSSNIVRRLHADMHIVSGNGVVHVSPTDTTSRTIKAGWPGTFVYVTIKLGKSKGLSLQKMMSEFHEAATQEIQEASKLESQNKYYLSIRNYFNRFAEDKTEAGKIRDKQILPAIAEGKSLTIDFDQVISAPHSFLSALLV